MNLESSHHKMIALTEKDGPYNLGLTTAPQLLKNLIYNISVIFLSLVWVWLTNCYHIYLTVDFELDSLALLLPFLIPNSEQDIMGPKITQTYNIVIKCTSHFTST